MEKKKVREDGQFTITVDPSSPLYAGLPATMDVLLTHGDSDQAVAPGFSVCGATSAGVVASIHDQQRRVYGVQFHLDMDDSAPGTGTRILRNFLVEVAGIPCAGQRIVFGRDHQFRDLPLLKDAVAVANEFVMSEAFMDAVLACLIPLAGTTDDDPYQELSPAAIVRELIHRLRDDAERQQQLARIRLIVSWTPATVVTGSTLFLMETEIMADGADVRINEAWAVSLKDYKFANANIPGERAKYLGLHSTLLTIKLIHEFCHALTHFLIEFVGTLDKSHRAVSAARAVAQSTTATSSSSSSQQVGVEAPPTSPPLHGLSWPTTKADLHVTPPKVGTERVDLSAKTGNLSYQKP